MRLIVLTFDRLPARLLACYGNEWMETPAFDQLAARSTVFEQHFAELPGEQAPRIRGGPGSSSTSILRESRPRMRRRLSQASLRLA